MVMKKLKRTFACFLTATMVLTSIAPAFAEESLFVDEDLFQETIVTEDDKKFDTEDVVTPSPIGSETEVTEETTKYQGVWRNDEKDPKAKPIYVFVVLDKDGNVIDEMTPVLDEKSYKATCEKDGLLIWTVDIDPEQFVEGQDNTIEWTIKAPGHKLPADVDSETVTTVYPTCEKDGYKMFTYSCERAEATDLYEACEFKGEDIVETIPATGHKYEYKKIYGEKTHATCTEAGSYTLITTCSNVDKNTGKACDYKTTEENVVEEATGHDWLKDEKGQPILKTQPSTCAVQGVEYKECSKGCIEVVKEVPKTAHEMELVGITYNPKKGEYAPTCEKDGLGTKIYHCKNFDECGYKETEETVVIPALGHTFEREGYVVGKDDKIIIEATCTTKGLGVLRCTDCGSDYHREYGPVAHTAGEAIADQDTYVEATCTEYGSVEMVNYCTVCGAEVHRERKPVEAEKPVGHTDPEKDGYTDQYTVVNLVEPTCTEKGSAEKVYKCQRCDEIVKTEPVVLKALGHDLEGVEESKEEVAATCSANGYVKTWKVCKTCGEKCDEKTTYSPKKSTAHVWKAADVVVAPTCTTAGKGYAVCKLCGKELEKVLAVETDTDGLVAGSADPEKPFIEGLDALGHTNDKFIIDRKEPTCLTTGEEKYILYCTRPDCKLAKVDDKNKKYNGLKVIGGEVTETAETPGRDDLNYLGGEKGHKKGEASYVKKEPTCYTEGVGSFVCEKCGLKYTETIPMLKHVYGEPETATDVTGTPIDPKTADCTVANDYVLIKKCTNKGCNAFKVVADKKNVKQVEHKYNTENVEFDYATMTAYFKCCNMIGTVPCSHVAEAKIKIDKTSAVFTKNATCTENGLATFTATATYGKLTATEKTAPMFFNDVEGMKATGHSFEVIVDGKVIIIRCSKCGEVDQVLTDGYEDVVITKQPTCTEKGAYTVNNEAVDKDGKPYEIGMTGHVLASRQDNVVPVTCETNGSYNEVVYCTACNAVISSTPVVVEAVGEHEASDVVMIENIKEATVNSKASYENVIYCKNCGDEMSREKVVIEKEANEIVICKDCLPRQISAKKVKAGDVTKKIHMKYVLDKTAPLTFTKVGGSSRILINADGTFTVKKGTTAGKIYSVKVKIKAGKTAKSKACTVTETITVKVG